MIILKMRSTLTTNSVEVPTIIDMLPLTSKSLVGRMKNSTHGVHEHTSVSPSDEHIDTNI